MLQDRPDEASLGPSKTANSGFASPAIGIFFAVLHAGENRGFNQFCLMFQLLHGDLRFSQG